LEQIYVILFYLRTLIGDPMKPNIIELLAIAIAHLEVIKNSAKEASYALQALEEIIYEMREL